MQELTGSIISLIYHNQESGYTIARFKPASQLSEIVIVGSIVQVQCGDTLKVVGKWVKHATYGEQFKVSTYQVILPQSTDGIKKYLASGMLKGIGPKTAERIVTMFGEATFDVLDHEPERLQAIPLLGKKKIKEISQAWQAQRSIRDVMVFLQEHNVSPAYAVKIHKQYRQKTVAILRENPYRLADDIFGIAFKTADRIAASLGFGRDSKVRLLAGVSYVLNLSADQGHVYLPEEELLEKAAATLEVELEALDGILASLVKDGKIIKEQNRYYLPFYYEWEQGIAEEVDRLLGSCTSLAMIEIEPMVKKMEQEYQIEYAPEQKQAIEHALKEKMMVLTGGPGTGKTTIIKAIISLVENLGGQVYLAAPTGRAAKRLAETTGQEALTVHRLLRFEPRSGTFAHDRNFPLENGVYIIDEASMLDTFMMYSLLSALPSLCYLILVGDEDQLPSVGAGNVLADFLKSGVVPKVRLQRIFRQAEQSLIVTSAHQINQGEMPALNNPKGGDLFFLAEENPADIARRIVELVSIRLPKSFNLDPFVDIQVLSPSYRGETGVENLNSLLQAALNPNGHKYTLNQKVLAVGDRVMQTKNNYDKEVYNGDIGLLRAVDPKEKCFYVDYQDRVVRYENNEASELVPAFAITIHKSQGSEYGAIVIPFSTQHYIMLQRNLLYTAITRARQLVVIVGSKRALAIAIKNNQPTRRFTTLGERLQSIKASVT